MVPKTCDHFLPDTVLRIFYFSLFFFFSSGEQKRIHSEGHLFFIFIFIELQSPVLSPRFRYIRTRNLFRQNIDAARGFFEHGFSSRGVFSLRQQKIFFIIRRACVQILAYSCTSNDITHAPDPYEYSTFPAFSSPFSAIPQPFSLYTLQKKGWYEYVSGWNQCKAGKRKERNQKIQNQN
jgi:hypothetical protein